MQMMGRCGVVDASGWSSLDVYSDGTVLDGPMPDELLANLFGTLTRGLPPFSSFGITARYVGPNALVLLQLGSPKAALRVDLADEDGNFRIEGHLLADFREVRALVNHGELGTDRCDPDPALKLPLFAFTCRLAVGDDEAWVGVSANHGGATWEQPLGELLARRRGTEVPDEYQRIVRSLPVQIDTQSALLASINEARAKLGRRPLKLAFEQSKALQPAYERTFRMNAAGNWTDDLDLRAEALKGRAVQGAVAWGQIVSGIAFDGDAGGWLSYQLERPGSREALMAINANQVAFAVSGSPGVGFGAAAVVYTLFTPELEVTMADRLANALASARGELKTRRLEDPPEFEKAAQEIALAGATPEEAFRAALTGANFGAGRTGQLDGFVLRIPWSWDDLELPDELIEVPELEYGVILTHHFYAGDSWASPVALIWFVAEPAPARHAAYTATMPETVWVGSP
jgi:hypothetical protein